MAKSLCVNIDVDTESLNKAIEETEHLIKLLEKAEQLNDSFKGPYCKIVIPEIEIKFSKQSLPDFGTAAEYVKNSIVSELGTVVQDVVKKTEDSDSETVVEFCSNCEHEIEMRWNVKKDGYKAFCPVCGNRLMLCDECIHRDGKFCDDCNYDSKTDSCKFNK